MSALQGRRIFEALLVAAPRRCVALMENTMVDAVDQEAFDQVLGTKSSAPLQRHSAPLLVVDLDPLDVAR